MTGSPASADGTGGPTVDRRWFEEALRSQGFVVEPPAIDDEPDGVRGTSEAVVSVEAVPAASRVPPSERPPVPSDLLARIASRGPGMTPAEPVAPGAGGTVADSIATPGALPAGTRPTVATPWGDALVATVAPWSTDPSPDPIGAPAGGSDATETARDAATTVTAASQQAPGESLPPSASSDVGTSAPSALVGLPGHGLDATHDAGQTLDDASAEAKTAHATAAAPSSPSAGPEPAEGELWALVDGGRPSAAQAASAGAVRVLLTLLTALLVLVVVVASLVLASQLA